MKGIKGIGELISRPLMLPAAVGGAGAAGAAVVAVVVAIVVAVVVVVAVRVLGGGPPADRTPDSLSGGASTEVQTSLVAFSIGGDASGTISPGVSVPIDFALTNSHDTVMTISDLQVVVRDVNAPAADSTHPCSVEDFTVEQVAGDREILLPAGATSTLSALGIPSSSWPQVGMQDRSVNQDGCKGASLALGYTASGTVPSS